MSAPFQNQYNNAPMYGEESHLEILTPEIIPKGAKLSAGLAATNDQKPPLSIYPDAHKNNFDLLNPPIDFESMPNFDDFGIASHSLIKPQNKNEAINMPFAVMSFDDLVATEYKPNWLIDGLIEKENLGLIFGSPASGKSLIVQDAAFCIAAGLNFHDKQTTQGNVLYIAGEGFAGLSKRFKALAKEYGCNASGLYFSKQPAALMDKQSALDVAETVKAIGDVSLIVIDTLHRNMGAGDENSSKDWGEFQNNIDNYLRPLGAAVLIVHHSGHNENGRSRGSSSIRGSMDVEFSVTKDGDSVTLTNTKMKDFEPPKPMAFNVKQVQINDDYSSVVLETAEYISKKSTKRLTINSEKTLSALRKATEAEGISPPKSIIELYPDSPEKMPLSVVNIEQWRVAAYEAITVDSGGDANQLQKNKRNAFSRIRNELEKLGLIGLHGGYAWAIDGGIKSHNFSNE